MNVPSPTNPQKTPLSEVGRDGDVNFPVNFSESALCEFAGWIDQELIELEGRFASYVTTKSQKRSIGR